jgi:hypothetical protein
MWEFGNQNKKWGAPISGPLKLEVTIKISVRLKASAE